MVNMHVLMDGLDFYEQCRFGGPPHYCVHRRLFSRAKRSSGRIKIQGDISGFSSSRWKQNFVSIFIHLRRSALDDLCIHVMYLIKHGELSSQSLALKTEVLCHRKIDTRQSIRYFSA